MSGPGQGEIGEGEAVRRREEVLLCSPVAPGCCWRVTAHPSLAWTDSVVTEGRLSGGGGARRLTGIVLRRRGGKEEDAFCLPPPHATVAPVGTGLTSRSCQSSPDLVRYAELLIFLQAGCRSAEMPPRLPGAWI